jgi:rhodanese-related sulfurtransferase
VRGVTTIEALLAQARAGLERLTAEEAQAATRDGAVLVDIRSADEQREQGGIVPGALHHPYSVVLWRLDELARDTRVIVLCRHGYSSSFVAAQLQQLGFEHATDVVDGFDAWLAAGLPIEPT